LLYCMVITNLNPSEMETIERIHSSGFQLDPDYFDDYCLLRFKNDAFQHLDLKQKKYAYYLSQAALHGRDIVWDQNFSSNLLLRRFLEKLYKENKLVNSPNVEKYLKYLWFHNGIHHYVSGDKISATFSEKELNEIVDGLADSEWFHELHVEKATFLDDLRKIIFDKTLYARKVEQEPGVDLVKASAVNFYENVSQSDADDYYQKFRDPSDPTPPWHGLNSKLVKTEDGQIDEKVWKIDGMYSQALEKVVDNLRLAAENADKPSQKAWIAKLIEYYQTGNLRTFDEYNIAWLADNDSDVDCINGFIEVYDDPRSQKATWESVVHIKDFALTQRFGIIAEQAAWFEKNSPIMQEHKKENPTGISYKVVQSLAQAGATSPTSPIGINLPNSEWIRERHGSKSISLSNIEDAYDMMAEKKGVMASFMLHEAAEKHRAYGPWPFKIMVGLHEVIGHGSGKLEPGVDSPKNTLKSYANVIEETRADLVALYFITDPRIVELKLLPDLGAGKSEYDRYFTNALMTQLNRVELEKNIEEAHMRNRLLIANWVMEKALPEKAIEWVNIDGLDYVQINDYAKVRHWIGQLLREVQRIKSQGDHAAAQALVENFGVRVDPQMHAKVKARFAEIQMPKFYGFLNPLLSPVCENGAMVDIQLSYNQGFAEQMMFYAEHYSHLPNKN